MTNRKILILLLLAVLVYPVEAQFRNSVPSAFPQTKLYSSSNQVSAILSKIFNPSVFQMSHSFEMSTGSFGENGYSMGMYTNTMAWQFSPKLAARMDVSVAYSPQNQVAREAGFGPQHPQIFLRNAELFWKPSNRVQFNFQVRQNPFGYHGMMGYGPYGHGYFHPYARSFSRDYWF